MQVIRQSLSNVIQRSGTWVRPSLMVQQIRFNGSDPRSSTSPDNHKSGRSSQSPQGSDLNKSKGGDKKRQSSTTTDDTQQPGATRQDWNNPDQIVGNNPSYGKATNSTDANNPEKGKN